MIDRTRRRERPGSDPGTCQVERRVSSPFGGGRASARGATALVATLSTPFRGTSGLPRIPRGVGWLQVRADRTGDLEPRRVRESFPGPLLYSLRSTAQGGGAGLSSDDRRERLQAAVAGYDLVELEAEGDLDPRLLEAIPPSSRLVSWRGPPEEAAGLLARLRRLSTVPARFYQVVVEPRSTGDGMAPLALLRAAGRRDLVAFADGALGLWSRVLSPILGAPLVYGTLDEEATLPGEPSVGRLIEDFGLPDPGEVDRVFGIAGDPVWHSLSPRLHNAGYRAVGVSGLFVPFAVDDFEGFWRALCGSGALATIGLPVLGLTVASPNKEAAAAVADRRSTIAARAWSANLFYRRGGDWIADSSDPPGVLGALDRRGVVLPGRRAAVVGCGGSGRAIALALARAGAEVALFNRGQDRGAWASNRLGMPVAPLDEFSARGFDLLVNATPVGRHDDASPFSVDRIASGTVVVDLVYDDQPTPLAEAARASGAVVVEGLEVLQAQVAVQFARMTGVSAPSAIWGGPPTGPPRPSKNPVNEQGYDF